MSQQIDMDAVIEELSKPNGWQKEGIGASEEPDGPVCLRGAFFRVMGGCNNENWDRLFRIEAAYLNPVIREQFPERVSASSSCPHDPAPVFLNWHLDTTLADVILVCEKARARMGEVA